ncbi:MAG: aminoacyl-tRNA hydrolase [Xanthomonadales bacterium]|nr:aminoacyl-tRNA hydrolase [Xanthomonadales bacterium]MBK7143723.1 aminoacyl-tRNA hydrolase [Xanthomonadales bacterium]
MLEINSRIHIPDGELDERFVRASGPGGQNVNKVSTAVELRFDARSSPSLPEAVRTRLLARADRRITDDGVVVIQANRFRSQERNREDARERLAEIIRAASFVPKARVATRPTRASKERRLDAKKSRSAIKRGRGTQVDHD